MSRNRDQSLPTTAESRILRALWKIGEGSIDEILAAFPRATRPNYKTTQTFLRIMEQKGYVDHEAKGRVFVFRPLVTREEIDRLSVKALVDQNFGGSAQGLFVNLLQSESLKESDLDALEALIQKHKESRR